MAGKRRSRGLFKVRGVTLSNVPTLWAGMVYRALAGTAADGSCSQGGNSRIITNNKTNGAINTDAAASKPSRPKIGG